MKSLLTGSSGFIGTHLKKSLEVKYDVECIEKDFDVSLIDSTVSDVDVIIHQGAITDTMEQDVNAMMDCNFEFSKFLFDAAHKHHKKVIYASSAACYGNKGIPTSIYAWSKYCAEQYGMALSGFHRRFVALRYFNVYGPGEEHKGPMASIAYQAMKKETMKLFPNVPLRDFVYVKDIVDANLYALEYDVMSGVYDVGTAIPRSFEDVCSGLNIPFSYCDESMIPEHYQFLTKADSSKWLPGWTPKYSLEEGLKEYENYFHERML